jgi:hypothetical protein
MHCKNAGFVDTDPPNNQFYDLLNGVTSKLNSSHNEGDIKAGISADLYYFIENITVQVPRNKSRCNPAYVG